MEEFEAVCCANPGMASAIDKVRTASRRLFIFSTSLRAGDRLQCCRMALYIVHRLCTQAVNRASKTAFSVGFFAVLVTWEQRTENPSSQEKPTNPRKSDSSGRSAGTCNFRA